MNDYDALCAYTLAHRGPAFVHQYVVDAHAAQAASKETKPIALTMALVGLHLHHDRGYDGRRVQRAHMALARTKRAWPAWTLPSERGALTPTEVLKAPEGAERDRAIEEWSNTVWEAYAPANRALAAQLLAEAGVP